MKNVNIILLVIGFYSCHTCDEAIAEPCGLEIPNSELCGWTVSTCYGELEEPIGVIYNTRNNHSAPRGDDWGRTIESIHPTGWTVNNLGQIFGVAIDPQSNIFLGSSDIYHYDALGNAIPSANVSRPWGPGQIFKCQGPLWDPVPFVDLECGTDPLNGVGNLAYDPWNDFLFATSMEDGKIYKMDPLGNIIDSYDPWQLDNGASGIVTQLERVWSLAITMEEDGVKIYFPRIDIERRELYSITLVDGDFPPIGSEQLIIDNLPGEQLIISDLAISNDGSKLLLGERGHPHRSTAFSYDRTSTGWQFNTTYFIGATVSNGIEGGNCAGGVDFAPISDNSSVSKECDAMIWVSGNYLDPRATLSDQEKIYGLEGIDYDGNNSYTTAVPNANQDTDLFIDLDGIYQTFFKRRVGDAEVFDCTECGDPCQLNNLIN